MVHTRSKPPPASVEDYSEADFNVIGSNLSSSYASPTKPKLQAPGQSGGGPKGSPGRGGAGAAGSPGGVKQLLSSWRTRINNTDQVINNNNNNNHNNNNNMLMLVQGDDFSRKEFLSHV
jgi:hypothetical protein